MMHREHVNLVSSDEFIDDAVGLQDDFPYQGILEFRKVRPDSGKGTSRSVAAMSRAMMTDA